jgi:hypothetical protein
LLGGETLPRTSNYTYWLREVKKSFDPNEAPEASTYITANE